MTGATMLAIRNLTAAIAARRGERLTRLTGSAATQPVPSSGKFRRFVRGAPNLGGRCGVSRA